MTTNFTLRDFFCYVLTGCAFLIAMAIPFHKELLGLANKYSVLNSYSWALLLLLIPGIYLIGHFFGTISYGLLWLYNKTPQPKTIKCKYMKKVLLLYISKINYAVRKSMKKSSARKYFHTVDKFWTLCVVLQTKDIYARAEYFYYLNDFFQSLILVFFISSIITFFSGHWIICLLYISLAVLACLRSKQYAGQFVKAVIRRMDVIDNNSQSTK